MKNHKLLGLVESEVRDITRDVVNCLNELYSKY